MRGDYYELWKHLKWSILIVSTRNYIVFIDEDGDLDWETTVEYDDTATKDKKYDIDKHNSITNDAALLEATPCNGFEDQVKLQFRRLIGEAIACSFDHDYVNARKMLLAAAQYFRSRSEETSRYWYLLASFGMAMPFIALGIVIWIWRASFEMWLGTEGMWFILASISGAVGALLSVIVRSGKLKFDSSAGRRLHFLEGSSRIWAGLISGLLVSLAVKSGIILMPLTTGENLHPVMILAALAGGAGERLASSIISKLDTTSVEIAASGNKSQKEERNTIDG